MEKEVYLLVGLGNYGAKYAHTRHNAGFDVVEMISQKTNIPMNRAKCSGLVGEGTIGDKRVVLCQPQTYMNDSGRCVQALLSWYKTQPQNLIVIYDDVDLLPGSVRVRKNGSSGTHNGMRSIIGDIGTEDFPRVRLGTGGKPPQIDLADWVLGGFHTKEERQVMFDAYLQAADAVIAIVNQGVEYAVQHYNHTVKGSAGA